MGVQRVLLWTALLVTVHLCWERRVDARCQGTASGYSHSGSDRQRYLTYKLEYSNCTTISSNLEIVFLYEAEEGDEGAWNETFDLSFLASIESVDGYVLITHNNVETVPLTSLRVVHGRQLFKYRAVGEDGDKYAALYVAHNYRFNSTEVGLREIQLTSLQEIVRGDVVFEGNALLCYEKTVQWEEIMGEGFSVIDTEQTSCADEKCDQSCFQPKTNKTHCWGQGPSKCQSLQNLNCSRRTCRRCPLVPAQGTPAQCCSLECAGGCISNSTDCFRCKNFVDGGVCVASCLDETTYDSDNMRNIKNPNPKYISNYTCVDKCPSNMVVEKRACVMSCKEGHQADENNVCVPCPDGCYDKKVCTAPNNGDALTSKNIDDFTNCTEIDCVRLLNHAFSGASGLPALTVADLSVLQSVRVITGTLQIQGSIGGAESLSFLRNLQSINGVKLCDFHKKNALQIVNTKLKTLGLTSLKTVVHGAVIWNNSMLEQLDLVSLRSVSKSLKISQNTRLCYMDGMDWKSITGDSELDVQSVNATYCESQNQTCSMQCEGGCWGEGPTRCLRCVGNRYRGTCLPDCAALPGLYTPQEALNESEAAPQGGALNGSVGEGDRECGKCDVECRNNCTGPNDSDCLECLHVRDDARCVPVCPRSKYTDPAQQCRPCFVHCTGGCTGPGRHLGAGGCNACLRYHEVSENETVCMDWAGPCPGGYYSHHGPLLSNASWTESSPSCAPCHAECATCMGGESYLCTSCVHLREVHTNHLPSPPTGTFPCVSKCQTHFIQATLRDPATNDSVDVCMPSTKEPIGPQPLIENPSGSTRMVTVVSVLGVAVVLAVVAVLVAHRWRSHRVKVTRRRKQTLLGLQDLSTTSPTDHKPDLSFLKLIKDSELTRGAVIGTGAFGTVYKGVWAPSGERVRLHVAIKVLTPGSTPAASVELLEEARIMAAVRHPCCIRILAVCLTAQLVLVTQLMPLGALLDYVRAHRARIGSNALIKWARQIAEGMQYLEEEGIVHRDLAARNVLVEGPQQVKITDFGLAKLLHDTEGYLATGGKVPIKWLALESIQHRMFTHKSDVWSYGVTLWELFTYGQRPHENVPAKEVCDVLEKGERLLQPPICTIDVYMIMIKCWMVEADSRPTFSELVEVFREFERDPGRYLVIQGDEELGGLAPTNLREMLRGLSVLEEPWGEGGGEIVSAEEYLKPHDLAIEMSRSRAEYTNNTAGGCDSQVSSPQESLSLSDIDAAFKAAPRHDRKLSFRYCPNPSREGLGGAGVVQEETRRPTLYKSPSFKPEPEIPEALVEDDYLLPRSAIPNYLEIVRQSSQDFDEEDALLQEKADYVNSSPQPIIIGNPEYYQPKLCSIRNILA